MSDNSTVVEAQPNPYNANKSWDTKETHARGLNGPNTSLFQPAPKVADEPAPEATQTETVTENVQEEATEKYSKVDYKKRYDDIKVHYDSQLIKWKAEKEQLEARMRATAPKTVPKTPEELATFKEQYSDVYDVVESVAHLQVQEQLEQVNKEIEALRESKNEALMQKAQLQLEKLHPDFNEISLSDDFHDWAKIQPAIIQEWIYDNPTDASLAARAIDLYKKDKGILSGTKKVEPKPTKVAETSDPAEAVLVKDSVNPTSSEKKIWTTSEIAGLSIAQYEKNQQELDAAFAEGRIRKG